MQSFSGKMVLSQNIMVLYTPSEIKWCKAPHVIDLQVYCEELTLFENDFKREYNKEKLDTPVF